MLSPYPVRLRSQSNPTRPRAMRSNSEESAVPAMPSPYQPSTSSATPPAAIQKRKSRPLTLFVPSAQYLGKMIVPRLLKKSESHTPNVPQQQAAPPPTRPPRNPARPTPIKRPSTSSGVPRPAPIFTSQRPSSSSGPKEVVLPWEPISPGGGGISPFASFADLRLTRKKSTSAKTSRTHVNTNSRSSKANSRSSNVNSRSSTAANSTSDHSNHDIRLSTADKAILEELRRNMAARDAQFITPGGKKHHPFSPEEAPYPRSYERQIVDYDIWEGQFMQQLCGSVTWHVFDTPPTKVLDLGCGTGTWLLDCARTWKNCHFVGLDIVPLHPDLQHIGSSDLRSRITWVQANFLDGLPFPNEEFDFVHVKRIARGVPEDKWDALFEEISRVMKPGGAFEMIEEDLYFPGNERDQSNSSKVFTVVPPPASPAAHSPYFPGNERDQSNSSKVLTVVPPPASPATHSPPTSPISHSSRWPWPNDEPSTPAQRQIPDMPLNGRPPQSFTPPNRSSRIPTLSPAMSSRVGRSRAYSFASSVLLSSDSPTASAVSLSDWAPRSPGGATITSSEFSSDVQRSKPEQPPPSFVSGLGPSTPIVSSAQDYSDPTFLLRTSPKTPVNPRNHSLLETIYTEMHSARFINLAPLSLLGNYLSLYFKDIRTHPPIIITFPPPSRPPADDIPEVPQASDLFPESLIDSNNEKAELDQNDIGTSSTLLVGAMQRRGRKRSSTANLNRSSTYIHTEEMVYRTQPYVTVDSARAHVLAPSSRASILASNDPNSPNLFYMPPTASPSRSRSQSRRTTRIELPDSQSPNPSSCVALSIALSADYAFDPSASPKPSRIPKTTRIPNRTFNFDLQSLNLHLAARVTEIMSCAEAMWNWLREYQASCRETPLHPRKWQSGLDEEVKVSLMNLSRADFDSLLTHFALDMSDHSALGTILESRLSWNVLPSPRSQTRRMFDTACDKWAEHQRQLARQRLRSHSSVVGPPASRVTDVSDVRRSFSDGHRLRRPRAKGESIDLKPNPPRRDSEEESCGQTSPSQRLSRTFRVFVAWKS